MKDADYKLTRALLSLTHPDPNANPGASRVRVIRARAAITEVITNSDRDDGELVTLRKVVKNADQQIKNFSRIADLQWRIEELERSLEEME